MVSDYLEWCQPLDKRILEAHNQAMEMTKRNIAALKILHKWAMKVKGFEEGQTEQERRGDIAVSEGPRVDDQMITDLPGELK